MSKIISIATKVPAYKHGQQAISEFADTIYSADPVESRKLKFLYRHSGIETRYSIIPDYSLAAADRKFYATSPDLEPFPTLEKRMDWYAAHAADISVQAIEACITGHIPAQKITHLITVSCTGMSAPGLDLEIMEKMNLPGNLYRSSINFMGCYAAIHALKQADAICKADKQANVVLVCTEFCTLHFQKEISTDNITSTLLFADGCAAVLVQSARSKTTGININTFFSEVAFKGKPDMSWKLSSTGFLMTLSGYVPDLVREDFGSLVEKALANAGIGREQITHWCIHPGGKKILEAIEKTVALPDDGLRYAYEVLQDYGNMSSPTILFVLKKILDELTLESRTEPACIFAAAFGPGLTMETFIATYD